MPAFTRARVLIVANQTADSDLLIEAVAQRASDGACSFTLMVPAVARRLRPVGAPMTYGYPEAERRLSAALPLLSQAAGAEVVGIVGSHEPFMAVKDALKLLGFDEVIVSMLPARVSRWRREDLPQRIRALGVAVIEVVADSNFEPVPAA
ncbi:MAG TPA: hypothetical protein VN880_10885 [Solirubrobacteraceae bacterium]|nr:hypothetical protein [Solirubrobacteraceae bacterium]